MMSSRFVWQECDRRGARTRILAMPNKLAPEMVGLKHPAEAQRIMMAGVTDLLTELSSYTGGYRHVEGIDLPKSRARRGGFCPRFLASSAAITGAVLAAENVAHGSQAEALSFRDDRNKFLICLNMGWARAVNVSYRMPALGTPHSDQTDTAL